MATFQDLTLMCLWPRRRELRVSPLVGEYLFDEVLVSQAGQATGRCLLEVQHHYVGHISQKESGPQGPDFSPA